MDVDSDNRGKTMTDEKQNNLKPLTQAEIEAARKTIEESISRACLAVTNGKSL